MRSTSAGDWFLPADGGAGSLLRVAGGVGPETVRRIRDLGLPGLLPIGNVVAGDGKVWLRTPQPPRPTLTDALRAPLTGADALTVLAGVLRVLAALHARGLVHGDLDGEAVLLDPDGVVLVVMVRAGTGDPAGDAAAAARLARALAAAWCARDPEPAALLHRCAALLEEEDPAAALDLLPPEPACCHEALRRLARSGAPTG